MRDELLDIGDVARATGMTPSALRFYERKGLIGSVGRNGLRRRFEPEVLDRLAIIALAQEVGFSLAEVNELFDADITRPAVREAIRAKADEVDQRIERLVTVRDRLHHAATCSAPRLLDCEHFQDCLRSALPRHGNASPVSR